MFGLLALLFVVIPILELFVIVQVAQGIGVVPTVATVIVVSAVGAWLCKREGAGLYRKLQRQLQAGEMPTTTVVDGFLVLLGGALLLTPGFLTDVVGLALLVPPVRALVRVGLVAHFARVARRRGAEAVRRRVVTFGYSGSGFAPGAAGTPGRSERGPVIDVGEATHRPGVPRDGRSERSDRSGT